MNIIANNNKITEIEAVIAKIKTVYSDKSMVNFLAKDLRKMVDNLIKVTEAGAGEFKWSAKAVKGLTKPANMKGGKPSIIFARDPITNEAWHTDGHYLKRGDIPGRFGDVELQNMDIQNIYRIIPSLTDDDIVTVIGAHEENGDNLKLSNGAVVSRLFLTYVMSGFDNNTITLANAGKPYPVVVKANDEVIGLVMPIVTR